MDAERTNQEVCLVKPKIGLVRELLGHWAVDERIIDLDYQLYVPGRFVFGHFKKRKEGFVLSPGGIYYTQAGGAAFETYTHTLAAGKLETVKRFFVPNDDLEQIAKQANIYQSARQTIAETIIPLKKYF